VLRGPSSRLKLLGGGLDRWIARQHLSPGHPKFCPVIHAAPHGAHHDVHPWELRRSERRGAPLQFLRGRIDVAFEQRPRGDPRGPGERRAGSFGRARNLPGRASRTAQPEPGMGGPRDLQQRGPAAVVGLVVDHRRQYPRHGAHRRRSNASSLDRRRTPPAPSRTSSGRQPRTSLSIALPSWSAWSAWAIRRSRSLRADG
jgi:hypothetical protein